MKMRGKSVAIIGAGPAGLAAAEIIAREAPHVHVVIFDKGRRAPARICPVDLGRRCGGCNKLCNVTSGFGGCLHYGDAIKLSLYPSGRRLRLLLGENYDELEAAAMSFFEVSAGEFDQCKEAHWRSLEVRPYPVAEISEGRLAQLLLSKYSALSGTCDVRMRNRVTAIKRWESSFIVTSTFQGRSGSGLFDAVFVSVGRSGVADAASWLPINKVTSSPGKLSIGVRFELPTYLLRPLYAAHKDFKFTERTAKSKVKSFCFSAHPINGGRVKYCHYQDQFKSEVVFIDGHVNIDHGIEHDYRLGNFALLMQVEAEGSARDWINSSFIDAYRHFFNGRPIWQPLSELLGGANESPPILPSVKSMQRGAIEQIIPQYVLDELLSSYGKLSQVAADLGGYDPSLFRNKSIVMAPAIEFFWDTVRVSPSFETSAHNFFALGDFAGLAQGNLQAAITGIAAAHGLITRL